MDDVQVTDIPALSPFIRPSKMVWVLESFEKKDLSDDMFTVPNETVLDAEYSEITVDESTGEVIENA